MTKIWPKQSLRWIEKNGDEKIGKKINMGNYEYVRDLNNLRNKNKNYKKMGSGMKKANKTDV